MDGGCLRAHPGRLRLHGYLAVEPYAASLLRLACILQLLLADMGITLL